jgi:hypothetical protein
MAKTVFFRATPQQQLVLGVGATKCLNKFDDYLLRVADAIRKRPAWAP